MSKKTSKSNLELKRRIKKAESEKREKKLEGKDIKVVTGDDGKKISFDQWWMLINKKVSLKAWMKEIIIADFGARGLGKSETEDKYNEALRKFGLSW